MNSKDVRSNYFTRYAYPKRFIASSVSKDLNGIIVIPCYDEPSILQTLDSLRNTEKPNHHYEVIIVVNFAENEPEITKSRLKKEFEEVLEWSKINSNNHIRFIPILADNLPKKNAGVGLARKIGMDEAASRLEDNQLIICLDADCTVNTSYLREIEFYFNKNPKINGASISFEHPIEIQNEIEKQGIIHYELFLRFYIEGQRQAKFPYAFHTVGSAMASKRDLLFNARWDEYSKGRRRFLFH